MRLCTFLLFMSLIVTFIVNSEVSSLMMLLRLLLTRLLRLFFFFQAEDGIRDGHVTGVQTCALPISRARLRLPAAPCRKYAARFRAAPRTTLPAPPVSASSDAPRAARGARRDPGSGG